MSDTVKKNLGIVTAYAYARSKGYTGTEEEFAELMASYADVAEEAAQSASEAAQSAVDAAESESAAAGFALSAQQSAQAAAAEVESAQAAKTGAEQAAGAAENSANTAAGRALAASGFADAAEQSATNASGSATAAQNYSGTAATAAQSASGYADDASDSATAAAGSATAAATSAAEAAESARTLTIDTTLTQQGQAADSKKTGDEISAIKADLNLIRDVNNLFDPSTITDGKRLDADGTLFTASGYFTSDYIKVIEAQKYTKNSPIENNFHRVAIYDISKVPISGQVFTSNLVTIPVGGAFIRICGETAEASTTDVNLVTAVDSIARKAVEDIKIKTPQIDGMLPNGKSVQSSNLFSKATKIATGKFVGAITNGKAVLYDSASYDTYIIPVDGTSIYTFTNCRTAAVVSDLDYTAVSALLSYVTTINSTDGSYILFSFNPTTDPANTYTITKPVPQYTIPNDWDISERTDAKLNSLLGGNGVRGVYASVTGGNSVTITTFPTYLKKNTLVSFYGKFSSFSGLLIGKGYNTYRGDWVEITTSNIIYHHYENDTDNTVQTDAHGLTISDYIMVMLFLDADGKLNCSINTKDGTFSTYRQTNYDVFSGNTFVTPTATMTDVEISVSNGETKNPVWCIGDSYFGVNDQRVIGQLKNLGFWDGILFDGLAGINSQLAYAELNRLLVFGMPKMLVWYLGMNDSNADYLTYMSLVKDFCDANNIILILNKVPTTPTMDKETIGGYVETSECRYIDSYLAVGTSSDGAWYAGYLSSDNVHPTALGAKALAMRMLVDVPELAEYGFKSVT